VGVTAGVGTGVAGVTTGVVTVAGVAASELAPPPPHAASEVHTIVERIRRVIVRKEGVMAISFGSGK
jgi:hypothetical protein